jgi:hypothetical protein
MRSSVSINVIIIIFIHVNILITPFLTYHAQGFDSVIRLPYSGSTRTRSKTKRVLSITDFGAKGDGSHNDTQVISLFCCFFILLFHSVGFYKMIYKM